MRPARKERRERNLEALGPQWSGETEGSEKRAQEGVARKAGGGTKATSDGGERQQLCQMQLRGHSPRGLNTDHWTRGRGGRAIHGLVKSYLN